MSRNQHYGADDLDYDDYYEEDYGAEYDDIPTAKQKPAAAAKASAKVRHEPRWMFIGQELHVHAGCSS